MSFYFRIFLFLFIGLRSNSQSIVFTLTPSSQTICNGSNVSLTVQAAQSSGNYVYSWSPSAQFANPSLSVQLISPSVTTVYSISAYDTSDPTTTIQTIFTITVKPSIPFDLGPNQMAYTGGTLNLFGPGGGSAYMWWGSTSFTANTQAISIPNLTPANSGYYHLIVDLNGCLTHDSLYVSVVAPIIYTLTPSNRTICRGESVNFAIGASQGPSGVYSYSWNPSIYLSSSTGSVQSGNPLTTTMYTISAYDVADPGTVIYYSFTLTVNQPPTPSIIIPTLAVCEPACYFFSSNVAPPANSILYDFGNGNFIVGDNQNICLNAGTHYLRILTTGTNGCNGLFDYTNTPISVLPKPASNFSYSPNAPNLTNNVVSFSPSSLYGSSFTYKWFFDATDSSSIQNPVKIYTSPGIHSVTLIVKNNYECSDTVKKVIQVGAALPDLGLFPNPTSGNLTIQLGILTVGSSHIQIYDVIGQLLFEGIMNSYEANIDVSRFADGFYVIKAESNGIIRKTNFIKK